MIGILSWYEDEVKRRERRGRVQKRRRRLIAKLSFSGAHKHEGEYQQYHDRDCDRDRDMTVTMTMTVTVTIIVNRISNTYRPARPALTSFEGANLQGATVLLPPHCSPSSPVPPSEAQYLNLNPPHDFLPLPSPLLKHSIPISIPPMTSFLSRPPF